MSLTIRDLGCAGPPAQLLIDLGVMFTPAALYEAISSRLPQQPLPVVQCRYTSLPSGVSDTIEARLHGCARV